MHKNTVLVDIPFILTNNFKYVVYFVLLIASMQCFFKYIWVFVVYYNICWDINKGLRPGKSSL